ncbi:helix-turn-helix transcriptional regulator [Streptomyces sp. E2N166]|uniref:helix-turn-helix domain-containing protein n=1 Tax=Streptomyces sp. E2N166 TaxID=1851909 RepID=UPI000EF6DDCE|nr:helix-turn-helix transcriptional regulator [Streptomyces sp. E2N166]
MTGRTITREHRALCKLLKKQLSTKGATLAQVGVSIRMSRSGVHHYVNGTGGRIPDGRTFDKLVKALGGDPTAETWKSAYVAACQSYGKKVTPPVVAEGGANQPQRPGRRGSGSGISRGTAAVMALYTSAALIGGVLAFGNSGPDEFDYDINPSLIQPAPPTESPGETVLPARPWSPDPTVSADLVNDAVISRDVSMVDIFDASTWEVVGGIPPGGVVNDVCRARLASSGIGDGDFIRMDITMEARPDDEYGYFEAKYAENRHMIRMCRP